MMGMHAGVPPSVTHGVHDGIDDALNIDPAGLADGELCDAVVDLYRAEARLAAARTRLLGELDARGAYTHVGAQTAAAYITKEASLPGGVARHHVQTARALRNLPATCQRFADGEINAHHVSRICRHHRNDRVRADLERDEAMLSREATHLPFGLFEKVLAYWLQHADPDGTDAEAQRARRRLHLSRTLGGAFAVDGLLDPIGGTIVATALRRIEKEFYDADTRQARERLGRDPVPGDLARNPAQRRADALVEMARRAMAAPADGRQPRPLLSILCSYETFAGRVCELADGTVLAPGQVAGVLDEAVIERVVFDGPSRIMDISHQRLFTGAARRARQLLDRHCTHPYCDRPAEDCHIDHIQRARHGGPTTLDNGRAYCSFHNHLRERQPEPNPDGDDTEP
jgi:hypothetical protein